MNFLTKFEALHPRKTHNMKEAWTLEVILAINLNYFFGFEMKQPDKNMVFLNPKSTGIFAPGTAIYTVIC